MRAFIWFPLLLLIGWGCSKEEDIPYIDADVDTIAPVYYHHLDGLYSGFIYDINLHKDSFQVLDSTYHEVNLTPIDFLNMHFDDIGSKIKSSSNCEVYRVVDGAWLRFDDNSMDSRFHSDYVYYGDFNGVYVLETNYLQYFIFRTLGVDTVHQVFQGYRL